MLPPMMGNEKCWSRHPMRRELYRVWIISHCCGKVSHKPTSRCFVLITMQVEAFLSTRHTNRVFRSCFPHVSKPPQRGQAPLWWFWRDALAGTDVNRTHPRRFARLTTVLKTAGPTGAHPLPNVAVFYQTEYTATAKRTKAVHLGRVPCHENDPSTTFYS